MSIAIEFLKILAGPAGRRCNAYIRVMNLCREKGYVSLAHFFSRRLNAHGLYISPKARISKSVKFKHPTAVVIGEGVEIDENVTIYQSVTLGGARIGDSKLGHYPKIGSGTIIFCGAVIVGNIQIGSNCVVGANSVVLNDIPDDSTCVGSPAKIIDKTKRAKPHFLT